MSLEKYKIFSTIIETGNLTKAAAKLHMTQSGVSYAMTTLETEMGFPLLKRSRSGIYLTTNGMRILAHIKKLLYEEDLLQQEAAAIRGVNTGTVRLGTLSSVAIQWLPGVLMKFDQLYPNIEVKTAMGSYDDMNDWLSESKVDMGFVSLPISKPFEVLPLKKDKLFVILPPKHHLQNRAKLSLADIKDEPFIMPLWGNDDNIRQMLRKHKATPRIIKYELMEEQTILAMVAQGLGITILPKLILNNLPPNLHIIDLEEQEYRIIGLAAISLQNASPANKKFMRCLIDWLQEQGELDFPTEVGKASKAWKL